MPTNPEDIELTDEHRRRIARIADQQGISWQTVVRNIMAGIEQMQSQEEGEHAAATKPTR